LAEFDAKLPDELGPLMKGNAQPITSTRVGFGLFIARAEDAHLARLARLSPGLCRLVTIASHVESVAHTKVLPSTSRGVDLPKRAPGTSPAFGVKGEGSEAGKRRPGCSHHQGVCGCHGGRALCGDNVLRPSCGGD
jgi:hypothetical protein